MKKKYHKFQLIYNQTGDIKIIHRKINALLNCETKRM